MGYKESEKIQVKKEFLRMLAKLELDPARMELIYGFFESYMKLNQIEEENLMNSLREGKEEGRKEGKQEIAKKMLAKGMEKENIIEITGLTKTEIDELSQV